ncbi:MAG TPA: hypothetical protein VL361_12320 [Candidatus Limnocylindrales bacterium]|nr:hypothetical protein [Candidatus Limnocylindrales bacterium]
MSRTAKTSLYLGLAICCALVGWGYSSQHSLLQRQPAAGSRGLMTVYLIALIAMVIALVALIASDLSRFFGQRAREWFAQGGAPIHSAPEFEAAEKLRSSGQPLEAIGVLREFLQNHPGELHVMSRIAEIYNYDLRNYLAAALEYEELLKHRLDSEQWAWGALHLAKLYGRLNEPEKSLALLQKLDAKYGNTVAGRRARKALEQLENPEGGTDEQAQS